MFISYKILHTECQHIYYVSLFQQNMIKSSKTLYYIDYGIKLRTGLMLYLIITYGQVVKQSSRLAVVTQLASQHACIVFIDLVEEGSNKSNFCHSKKNKSCRCRVLLSICVKENYTFIFRQDYTIHFILLSTRLLFALHYYVGLISNASPLTQNDLLFMLTNIRQ